MISEENKFLEDNFSVTDRCLHKEDTEDSKFQTVLIQR